jgi:hypothetical protein
VANNFLTLMIAAVIGALVTWHFCRH